MPDIDDVRKYWNAQPLLSHEVHAPGTSQFFAALDRAKREDSEKFAMPYWEFNDWKGKKVLDIGCGPGWVSIQYAANGALVDAVDLTPRAVEIAQTHAQIAGVAPRIAVGNAEALQFPDATFDLVVSSGVLHHTPNTAKAISESFRVLKPGGRAKITLYRKGILHNSAIFPLTRIAMKIAGMKHPGADLARTSQSVNDFIRQYDGAENPIGIGHSNQVWARILEQAGYTVTDVQTHFFPKRFLPFAGIIPDFLHYLLDRGAGSMAYFTLSKP